MNDLSFECEVCEEMVVNPSDFEKKHGGHRECLPPYDMEHSDAELYEYTVGGEDDEEE